MLRSAFGAGVKYRKTKSGATLMVILAFATVYIVWGSTYFFIQQALKGFPPFLLGAVRFLIAGFLMLGWCFLRREQVFDWPVIKHAAVGGVLMLFVGNGMVIWVEQTLPSAMAAIMVSTTPLWFVILDKPNWDVNFRSVKTIIGLIMGFAGILLLFSEKIMGPNPSSVMGTELLSLFLLTIGVIGWAGGSLYVKYKQNAPSAQVNTAWQMTAAGVAFIPGMLIRGEAGTFSWEQVPAEAWSALIFLVLMGSIVAFSAYVWLLQIRPATQVSTYAYVNPVVAVLLGVFFAGEKITLLPLAGLAIILLSVLMINIVKPKQIPPAMGEDTAVKE